MRLAVSDPAVRHVPGITGADRVIGTYPTVPLSLMGGPAPPGGPDHPRGSATLKLWRLGRLTADSHHDRGGDVTELDVAVL
jgi:hypothetical protein